MRALSWVAAGLLVGAPAAGQSLLERSPNLQGTWTLPAGQAAFVFAHRFELLNGADELRNLPTLTLAAGLPWGLSVGLDYTSNSELTPALTGGNELQYWVRRSITPTSGLSFGALAGWNTAAQSLDGAVSGRVGLGRAALHGEVRAFSDAFGAGRAGAALGAGATLRLTPYLALGGDLGRMLTTDTLGVAWSAAAAIAIPGTPHTFSLQASNVGATTLQGVSRKPADAIEEVRYGFTFTVPLGTASQWSRIFRPAPAPPPAQPPAQADTVTGYTGTSTVRIEMRQIAYAPREIRIRAGQRVEWVNSDPTVHTVNAQDGSWASELILEGGTYGRVFEQTGRYEYYCLPHPMMKGVVVVEP